MFTIAITDNLQEIINFKTKDKCQLQAGRKVYKSSNIDINIPLTGKLTLTTNSTNLIFNYNIDAVNEQWVQINAISEPIVIQFKGAMIDNIFNLTKLVIHQQDKKITEKDKILNI